MLIVGCPRSGTTLVRDLLRSHPRLTFPHETNVLPNLYRLHGNPRTARQARRLASDLLHAAPIRRWGLDLRPQELEAQRSFSGLVAAVFESWAARERKPRWGDKTPLHVLQLPLALEIFPGAQVVHVIRDGRDVAVSSARQPFGAAAYKCALQWRSCIETGQARGAALGPGIYHELRYEELLADPERVLRRLCAFLGEEFDPAVLAPNRLPPPGPLPQSWAPKAHEIDRGNAARWPRELSAADLLVVESVAGDTLDRLGYGRSGGTRAIGRLERARWRASDRARFVRFRLTTWDRVPRAETNLRLVRARCLRILGLTAAR